MQKYLENISEYIIENYVDIEYCETISGYEKEIFIIKFNNIIKKFFENAENKGTIWKCKQRHKKE